MITITLDDTITIPLGRNSVYGTLAVEVARLPANALEYVWMYGLKQVINDAMATKVVDGVTLENDAIAAKAANKLDALYEGNLRMRSEAVAADAYEAEALREAKRYTIAVFTKAGLMKNIPPKTENRLLFALHRHLKSVDKPLVTEAEYFATFFTTPKGQAIKEQAIKTVNGRRADVAEADDMLDELGLA
jgi:hypothetical protein